MPLAEVQMNQNGRFGATLRPSSLKDPLGKLDGDNSDHNAFEGSLADAIKLSGGPGAGVAVTATPGETWQREVDSRALEEREMDLDVLEMRLQDQSRSLGVREAQAAEREQELQRQEDNFEATRRALDARSHHFADAERLLTERSGWLAEREGHLAEDSYRLLDREREVHARHAESKEQRWHLEEHWAELSAREAMLDSREKTLASSSSLSVSSAPSVGNALSGGASVANTIAVGRLPEPAVPLPLREELALPANLVSGRCRHMEGGPREIQSSADATCSRRSLRSVELELLGTCSGSRRIREDTYACLASNDVPGAPVGIASAPGLEAAPAAGISAASSRASIVAASAREEGREIMTAPGELVGVSIRKRLTARKRVSSGVESSALGNHKMSESPGVAKRGVSPDLCSCATGKAVAPSCTPPGMTPPPRALPADGRAALAFIAHN